MAQEREDLIHSLAKSMGVGDAQKAKYTSNKFNTETGAMYANGHAIPRGTIEQAKVYFTNQYRKIAEKDDEGAKEMAMLYEVAVEAINMMVESTDSSADSSGLIPEVFILSVNISDNGVNY